MKKERGLAIFGFLILAIVGFFVVGLILGQVVKITNSVGDGLTETTSASLTNSTTDNAVTDTNFTAPSGLDPTNIGCALTPTIVTNATDGAIISADNYTVSGCRITYAGAGVTFNNTVWNITGTYTVISNSELIDITNKTAQGLADQSNWFSTYNSLVAAVVILGFIGLLIGALAFMRFGALGGGGGGA